jgi:lysophospholipase L1-like esterase
MLGMVLAVLILCSPANAKFGWGHKHRPVYYLALGTSLAAGIQVDQNCDNVLSNVSYPKLLVKTVKKEVKNLELVNLSCPGETSQTFIDGGKCPYPLKSQLNQAVAFLTVHRNSTKLITIDLGANDALACVDIEIPSVDIDFKCFLDKVDALESNLEIVLSTLRAVAPEVPIIGMNYYNPLLVSYYADQSFAALTVALQKLVNLTIEQVFSDFGIPVADVSAAFMADDLHTDIDYSGLPDSLELLCAWTWMCPPCYDIHPNNEGYQVMAEAFEMELPPFKRARPFRRHYPFWR